MTIRQVPPELDVDAEVPEADAAEQHADIVEEKEAAEVDHPVDDERVVVLDDDEYR